MATEDTCQLCGEVDSWRHSLIECPMARSVWALQEETIVEEMIGNMCLNAKNWLFSVRDSISHADFVKFAITLWEICTARRKAIHESIYQSPLGTKIFIDRYVLELSMLDNA